jgi:hypothetical protein
MKNKLFLATLLFSLSGCFLLAGGPRATLEKYLSNAKDYNLDGMFSLMSNRLINEIGADKIKKDNQKFSDAVSRGNHKMQIISETVSADTAKIIFFYKDAAKNDSVRLGFKFVKQSGDWKIDGFGFGDPDGDAPPDEESETPIPSPTDDIVPPPPEPRTNKVSKPKR